jgi:hypothetical protein
VYGEYVQRQEGRSTPCDTNLAGAGIESNFGGTATLPSEHVDSDNSKQERIARVGIVLTKAYVTLKYI